MFNLLDDPLLRVAGQPRAVTLPEALALLVRDEVEGWPGRRPHQEHAWHAFLVQLAAVALGEADGHPPFADAAAWRTALLGLTGGSSDPWSLVVGDLSRPAFLQPPVPEGNLTKFREEETPDAIDLLVTAKNHDVKAARATGADPEAWVYALVSLQTTGGFSGRGNYGVARMNGGFGNRACIAYAPSLRPGRRFVYDLARLRADEPEYDTLAGPVALTWLRPWGGDDSLGWRELAPWYIEVCRRVRLVGDPIRAMLAASTAPRIAADFQRTGPVRDGWCPIKVNEDAKKDEAPRLETIGPQGFSYSKVVDILIPERLATNAASKFTSEARWLVLRALVRGQGTTEGYHTRDVPVPGDLDIRAEEYGQRARTMVSAANDVRLKVLRTALARAQSAGTSADGQSDPTARLAGTAESVANRAGRRFDARVDQEFFPYLWTEGWSRRGWLDHLVAIGEAVLAEAVPLLPVPSPRRRLTQVTAESAWRGNLYRLFPELKDADPPRADQAPGAENRS